MADEFILSDEDAQALRQMLAVEHLPKPVVECYTQARNYLDRISGGTPFAPQTLVCIALQGMREQGVRSADPWLQVESGTRVLVRKDGRSFPGEFLSVASGDMRKLRVRLDNDVVGFRLIARDKVVLA